VAVILVAVMVHFPLHPCDIGTVRQLALCRRLASRSRPLSGPGAIC